MKKPFFTSALFSCSLLQADGFGTVMMSGTLFILLFTLIIALMLHLKNLQRENLRYRTLFHLSDMPTLLIDAEGRIRDINASAQTLLGYTKEQFINQKWFERVLPDERSLPGSYRLYQEDRTREKSEFSATLTSADGDALEVAFTLTRLPEPLKGSILTLVETRRERVR